MNTVKTILISQIPLPFHKIGSWSTLYKNYLDRKNHQIDYIVCEQPKTNFTTVEYSYIKTNYFTKLKSKLIRKNKLQYLNALSSILEPNQNYIIQVVDNVGLIPQLVNFLEQKKMRNRCYIQFFYHGFSPMFQDRNSHYFFNAIDEMVVLTNLSYKAFKDYYTVLPCKFTILYNGIDTSKFCLIDKSKKNSLKTKINIKEEVVFLWCSQDRPKKGLHIILEAWLEISKNHPEARLLVIGTEERKEDINNITYLGKVANDHLPQYYQISDVYLFPTLCQEGFGMSLVEALNCGCYCIASENGGVTEVLQNGKLGKLIENPNFISEWINAIKAYLEDKDNAIVTNKPIYTFEAWQINMNNIITKAKESFHE